MGWKKRDFVTQAFEEIGYASYVYDAMPEQLESILLSLDAMMATWNAKGIRVGYPIASSPSGADLDQETDVPDSCNEAIYLNLACRIGPRFGKTLQQDTKQAAKEAYDALLVKIAMPLQMQFPNTTPAGAGNKTWLTNNGPFLNTPVDPLLAGQDDDIDFS
jgi:P22 tail accessory factor